MVILIMLVILWTYAVTKMPLHAQQARPHTPDRSQQARAEPPRRARSSTCSQDGQVWSTLDDHQLTRLLTESTPRITSE